VGAVGGHRRAVGAERVEGAEGAEGGSGEVRARLKDRVVGGGGG
jgi:hypothetical protein